MQRRNQPLCKKTEVGDNKTIGLGFDSLTTKRVNLFAKHKECAYVKNFGEHIGELLFGYGKVEFNILVENEPTEVVLPTQEMGSSRLHPKFLG